MKSFKNICGDFEGVQFIRQPKTGPALFDAFIKTNCYQINHVSKSHYITLKYVTSDFSYRLVTENENYAVFPFCVTQQRNLEHEMSSFAIPDIVTIAHVYIAVLTLKPYILQH